MHEARHRPIRRNPRYLHTVRRVAPSSGGHVVQRNSGSPADNRAAEQRRGLSRVTTQLNF
jgi:hypothetical protein